MARKLVREALQRSRLTVEVGLPSRQRRAGAKPEVVIAMSHETWTLWRFANISHSHPEENRILFVDNWMIRQFPYLTGKMA
jgi:hypothetical protein